MSWMLMLNVVSLSTTNEKKRNWICLHLWVSRMRFICGEVKGFIIKNNNIEIRTIKQKKWLVKEEPTLLFKEHCILSEEKEVEYFNKMHTELRMKDKWTNKKRIFLLTDFYK